MQLHQLNLSSFEKAINSLDEAVIENKNSPKNKFIRDAMIQRFEYTYELSHKMIKRYLESTEPSSEEIDSMSFSHLIRTASERGLLHNGWDLWKVFRDARNLTSHTYNEEKAAEVCQIIPDFLKDAQFLFQKLRERINYG